MSLCTCIYPYVLDIRTGADLIACSAVHLRALGQDVDRTQHHMLRIVLQWYGDTAMLISCGAGRTEAVTALLQAGADLRTDECVRASVSQNFSMLAESNSTSLCVLGFLLDNMCCNCIHMLVTL